MLVSSEGILVKGLPSGTIWLFKFILFISRLTSFPCCVWLGCGHGGTCRVTTNLGNPSTQWFLQTWKTPEILVEFCVTFGEIFNKQNSFSLIKYLHNTTRSWASNEESLVNFGDDHCALMTCYIATVDVEWALTCVGHYYIYFLLQ